MSDTPSLQLAYRPDLDVLTARWSFDPAPAQLRQDYEDLLAAGLAHGTARWLLDLRRRPTVQLVLAHWVTNDWLPRVAAQAPAGLRMAFLLTPQRDEFQRADPAIAATVQTILVRPEPYTIQLFHDEGPAVHWLTALPTP
ncbi:hypothetical protein ACVWYF_002459 [Hymenobacter sp. UYAg731]